MLCALCAGNAAHVLVGQLSSRGALCSLLSTYPGEADAIRNGLSESPTEKKRTSDRGIVVKHWCLDRSGTNFGTLRGTPVSVASRVESAFTPTTTTPTTSSITTTRDAVEYYDCIIIALPAFAHDTYLNAMAPYLASPHPSRPPTVLVAAVAQGGFDLAVRAALTRANVTSTVVIAGLETLPWACRLVSQGSECEILGTKTEVDVAIAAHPNGTSSSSGVKRHIPRALDILQAVVGHAPRLRLASGFLGVTLMNINSLWHPTLMYHRWNEEKDGWDGEETFETPPLFYEGASDDVGVTVSAMSKEVANVCAVLKDRYGDDLLDDLSSCRDAYDWFIRAYSHESDMDCTSVTTMLRTNPAYQGLTHPMKKLVRYDDSGSAIPDAKPRLVPDFHHRYLSEDIPYGLVVTRGIAELAGVPTPTIDAVITWSQKVQGLSYLTAAKPGGHGFSESDIPGSALRLNGDDVARSRCPQRYGWFDLDWFVRGNGYVVGESEYEEGGANLDQASAGGEIRWSPGTAQAHLMKESHSTEGITTSSEEGGPCFAGEYPESTGAA